MFYLGVADYAVLAFSLLVPLLIGTKFRSSDPHVTTGDYFLAGRRAGMFPVVMSTTVTLMSSIIMLGIPAETYKFGLSAINISLGTPIGIFVSTLLFLPVYFRCGVSSVYELLEMRFGKFTRYTISAVFILQTVLYMCTVLLGSVLAINAVTGFSMEMAITVFGAVCTFYCVLGGLKAVLWADVFQAGLMFVCIFIVYAVGVTEAGGVDEITRRAAAGHRLNFDFRLDLETRYTFWNCFVRGCSGGLAFWGINQMEVQRALSMNNYSRAQRSVLWSIFPVFFLQVSCHLIGTLLYAVFYLCDPVMMLKESGISKYDQLVPYFIVSRLHTLPGLTGLCFAGVFSGTLSTMSSALNSLATVTVVDFIRPTFTRMTDARTVDVAKLLGVLYGIICIVLTFVISKTDSIVHATVIFQSLTEGPVLAIFLIAVLTRKVNDKCAVIGLVVGVCVVGWIGFGSLVSGYRYAQLPLETSGCLNGTAIVANSTGLAEKLAPNREVFALYKVAFSWVPPIGCLVTVFSLLLISLLLDGNKNVISPDSKCLSPVVRYWMNISSEEEPKENAQEKKTELRNLKFTERSYL